MATPEKLATNTKTAGKPPLYIAFSLTEPAPTLMIAAIYFDLKKHHRSNFLESRTVRLPMHVR
jgi:hypothetical protein